MIRMSHPEHGFQDVQTLKEAEEMMKNGWTRVEPEKGKAKG